MICYLSVLSSLCLCHHFLLIHSFILPSQTETLQFHQHSKQNQIASIDPLSQPISVNWNHSEKHKNIRLLTFFYETPVWNPWSYFHHCLWDPSFGELLILYDALLSQRTNLPESTVCIYELMNIPVSVRCSIAHCLACKTEKIDNSTMMSALTVRCGWTDETA